MNWLYRYIFGNIALSFYGEFPERILNLCAQNNISVWGTKLLEGYITLNMSLNDFYSLKTIMRGSGIKLHITEKRGLPFLIYRHKKRPGIIVGIIAFMVILELLSSFIWIIDIEGNKNISDDKIINACSSIGIKIGMKSSKIHTKSQRERLLLELDGLSWAALNIEGSRLTVNVSEAKENKVNENQPCNLKAEYDGIIKKIDVTSGNCVVKVGDTVKKGDVLVSGIIENVGGTRFVRSAGTVTAAVEKNYTLREDFKKNILSETGKRKTKRVLELLNFKIPLYLGGEKGTYNESFYENQPSLFGRSLPLKIYKKQFSFTEKKMITRDEKALYSLLEKEMNEIFKKEKNEKAEVTDKDFSKDSKGVSLKFTIQTEENIACSDFLLISTGN